MRILPAPLPALVVLAISLSAGCVAPPRPAERQSSPSDGEVVPPPQLRGLAKELTETAHAVRPSVVRIRTETQLFKPVGSYLLGLLERVTGILTPHPYWEWPYRVIGFPFYLLFGYFDFSSSRGSGFFIEEELVVTNAHVVNNAARVICQLVDGRSADAELVSVEEELDLALLRVKVRGEAPQPLVLRRSAVRPGEPIMAVGYPTRELLKDGLGGGGDDTELAPNPRVTVGIVSATEVQLGNPHTRYVETDAALNPGNSGGPVVGLDGGVVGVSTMKGIGKENEGYAVPTEVVLSAFKDHLAQ